MKILICVSAFNRKKTLQLCLSNLKKYKQDASLWIYNDSSTEYDNEFLASFGDRVVSLPDYKKGDTSPGAIDRSITLGRWYQLRQFLANDEYDWLYFTDADAFHDPEFLDVLKNIGPICNTPLTLYTSKTYPHDKREPVSYRYGAGGISHFYSRKHVERIVAQLDKTGEPITGWDFRTIEYTGGQIAYTRTSYVEHFGAGGLHAGFQDFETDRAKNPTTYLQKLRRPIISYLISNRSEEFIEG